MKTRYAIVRFWPADGRGTPQRETFRARIAAYLPENYSLAPNTVTEPDGFASVLIVGRDVAGWTLDGYVVPRLASGMIHATELIARDDSASADGAALDDIATILSEPEWSPGSEYLERIADVVRSRRYIS